MRKLILILLFLATTSSSYVFGQDPYTLPSSSVLRAEGITRIDVMKQHLKLTPDWKTRVKRDERDTLEGQPVPAFTYFINSEGKTDSLIEWGEENQRSSSTGLTYDDQGRVLSIRQSFMNGDEKHQKFNYYQDSMRFEVWQHGKWTRKLTVSADTILLTDHTRNETDSALYRYLPEKECVTSKAFTKGGLAYVHELCYIMRDGQPDSLYYKSDFYKSAFGIVMVEGAPEHCEGTVDVIYNGEAVVPESSPIYGTIQTGFRFGDHRTMVNWPRFRHEHLFTESALIEETDIWPTFLPLGGGERVYYVIEYAKD